MPTLPVSARGIKGLAALSCARVPSAAGGPAAAPAHPRRNQYERRRSGQPFTLPFADQFSSRC